MPREVQNQIVIDPEIEAEARIEGRLAGAFGESFAHTTGDAEDVSGHMEIGFKSPRQEGQDEINIRFKRIMDDAFGSEPISPDLSPDSPLDF